MDNEALIEACKATALKKYKRATLAISKPNPR